MHATATSGTDRRPLGSPSRGVRKEGSGAFVLVKDGTDATVIKGYFSTVRKDRDGDVILPSAFDETLADRPADYIPVLRHHDPSQEVAGHADKWGTDRTGAWVEATISRADVVAEVRRGDLRAFSWYGYIQDWVGREEDPDEFERLAQEANIPDEDLLGLSLIITKVDLIGITLTATPANPYAMFQVLKTLSEGRAERHQGQALPGGSHGDHGGNREAPERKEHHGTTHETSERGADRSRAAHEAGPG